MSATTSFGEWITSYPRSWVLRALHRAPIPLWRLGLGGLLGRVLILVTTRGRASGLVRRAVVARHEMGGRIYALCPYGERAQWYRNLTADPHVTLQTHGGPLFARAIRVTDEDELTGLYRHLEQSDRASLEYLLDQAGIGHDPCEMVANKERVHIVCFDPAGPSGLAPLRSDLAWVWPAALVAWMLVHRARTRP